MLSWSDFSKRRSFFNQDACPTCGQDIDHALKEGAQSRIQKEMNQVDDASLRAAEMMAKQQDLVDYYTELNEILLKFQQPGISVRD